MMKKERLFWDMDFTRPMKWLVTVKEVYLSPERETPKERT